LYLQKTEGNKMAKFHFCLLFMGNLFLANYFLAFGAFFWLGPSAFKTPKKCKKTTDRPQFSAVDWPLTQFGFFGHCGAYIGSFCVFGPVLGSPAHAAASLAMPLIEIEVVWIL
jgi:hypothetical protein